MEGLNSTALKPIGEYMPPEFKEASSDEEYWAYWDLIPDDDEYELWLDDELEEEDSGGLPIPVLKGYDWQDADELN